MDAVEIWSEKYRPIKNHIDVNAGWDGELFETYGEEYEFVKATPCDRVWTWVDCGDGSVLLSGHHWCNRIGYLITEVPYEGADSISVVVEE